MPVILARIDDRLIHGQVTEGWGKILKPELIVVVSNEVASSDWEKELCLAALPVYLEGNVVKIDDAAKIINELNSDHRASYILFESPHDAYMVVQKGAHITTLNVGGMHSTKDKREILGYIFVDEDDSKYLKALRDKGISLDFRDLPNNENVDVMSLL
ncbi:PTS system mannose/fructose/N-acetylgalactosamine-transporter subunit IIB [Candidatus Latescibacterota bacterium]